MSAFLNPRKLHTPLREAPGRGETKGSWYGTYIENRLLSRRTETFVPQEDSGTWELPGSSAGSSKSHTLGGTTEQESLCEPPVTFHPEVNH